MYSTLPFYNNNKATKSFAIRTIFVLVFTTLIRRISSSRNEDYDFTGASPCPQNSEISGYSKLITLNQDMYLNALDVLAKDEAEEEEYLYTLCPNSTFDIDEASKNEDIHEAIAIFLNNTVLRCGTDAKLHHGTCIVQGGNAHIVFTPVLETRNAVFKGLTFVKNHGYSVAAYGHPASDATFIDCSWTENESVYLLSIYYKPWDYDKLRTRHLQLRDETKNDIDTRNFQQLHSMISSQQQHHNIRAAGPISRRTLGYSAMSVELIKCTFENNVLSGEVINDQGGHIKLIDTKFINNIVKFAVVVVAYGGQLSIEQNTEFQENISPFVPVFVDGDSYLTLNVDNTGSGNLGIACLQGIFLEKDNSYCLEGGKCDGECCPFGDESCDRYEPENASIQGEMQPGAPTNDIETASYTTANDEEYKLSTFTAPDQATVTYKDQTKTVKWLSVLVGILTLALVVMFGLFVFMKGKRHALIGLVPDDVLD